MKLRPTLYKGIEFVNLHELPADQVLLLQHNNQVERIKILIEGKIISDCIQYSTYCEWYTSVFEHSVTKHIVEKQISEPVLSQVVVLGKL